MKAWAVGNKIADGEVELLDRINNNMTSINITGIVELLQDKLLS
jgi:hypothetical protein